jgi:hypothetical protein
MTKSYDNAVSVNNAFLAGKNKIINGDFNINQRAFTSTTTADTYGFDRWRVGLSDGTVTYSAQTFTLGTAPVSGYENKNFARIVTTGQTAAGAQGILVQRIESVRTLAGQTATISFWAKANTGTPKIALDVRQRFGTGGSPSSNVSTYGGQATLSTSWARYSLTVSVPSLSGITLGTNSDDALEINLWVSAGTDFNSRTGSLGIQSNTFDVWGVQVEAGSVATPFTAATGTLQGELAACQRYYYRTRPVSNAYGQVGTGMAYGPTTGAFSTPLPVAMRTTPSAVEFSSLTVMNSSNSYAVSALTLDTNQTTTTNGVVNTTHAFGTITDDYHFLRGNNSTSAYIGFTAEL